jgi:hypothetical protein
MTAKIKQYYYRALLGVGALLICLCNPLHPLAKNTHRSDSSFFLLIGKLMQQGIMPYRDTFDHKGPLLYVISWLGMLGGYTGVWLIGFAGMLISVMLCFKTARRFFGEVASFLSTAATFITLIPWYGAGNYAEIHALPFWFGALYCLTGYFTQDYELSRKQIVISGACMGGVLMLKPNMIGVWVGMCAVIFVHSIIIKKTNLLPRYVVFFSAGIIIVIMPFVAWMWAKGMLDSFYRCYIQFNFAYIDVPLTRVMRSIYNIFQYPLIPIVLAVLLVLFLKERKSESYMGVLSWSAILMFGVTIVLSSLNGSSSKHYLMALLPCLVIPTAWLVEAILNHFNPKPILALVLTVIILNQSIGTGMGRIIDTMRPDVIGTTLAAFVKNKTAPGETILYIGHHVRLYLLAERYPAGYYAYFSPPMLDMPTIIESYIEELALRKPRIVVYGDYYLPDEISDYINENYTVIYECDVHKVCEINENFNS